MSPEAQSEMLKSVTHMDMGGKGRQVHVLKTSFKRVSNSEIKIDRWDTGWDAADAGMPLQS